MTLKTAISASLGMLPHAYLTVR